MAERRKFDVSLVTPEGAAFEGEAEMMIVPGAAGEIGVLARHAPLVATLKAGSTRVYLNVDSDDVREFATGSGFFKVELDRAIALVDDAVDAKEIDDVRARQQLEEARAGGWGGGSATPRTSWAGGAAGKAPARPDTNETCGRRSRRSARSRRGRC